MRSLSKMALLTIGTAIGIYSAEAPAAQTAATPAGWTLSGSTGLTLGLNTYSGNWAGGEAGSLSWAWQFNGSAQRQFTPSLLNKTTLKLAFGQTKIQSKDTKRWSAPQKSTDLIDIENLSRITLNGAIDPFISVRAITQFLDGSDTLLSRYGNPVEITEGLGVAREIVKQDLTEWNARLGAAARQSVDRHKLDAATGTRKTDVTNDGGIELNTELKAWNKEKYVTFASVLKIYEALFSTKAKDLEGTPQETWWRNPNINWENTLNINVTKYIMASFYVQFLYDRLLTQKTSFIDDVRMKHTTGLGLSYTF